MKRTMIIGLTGGIASGKSTAANAFKAINVPLIDADDVAREVVEPGQPALAEIEKHFGADVILPSGELDRATLRTKVFTDDSERVWLERLLHPLINTRIRDWLLACKSPYCVLVSPLLMETQQKKLVDRILLIDVPESVQISRTMNRDNSSRKEVEAILKAQSSREFKLEHADDIILNDKDTEYLESEVRRIHEYYLELAAQHAHTG